LGANLGVFTLRFAQLVGQKGKVYAFEANPTIFKLLESSVLLNKFKNIHWNDG
jgi:FkbM family methyltransferase